MEEITIFVVMLCEPYDGSHALGHFSTFEGAYNHALNEVRKQCDNGPDDEPDVWTSYRSDQGNAAWRDAKNPYDTIHVWPITVRQDLPEVA